MGEPKVIVSLTSHTAERIKNLPFFLYSSIFKHNFDYVKVVLTLFKDDVKFIPDALQKMIYTGMVELLVADINLRCHLKYFYAMSKYRTLPVITIDDDSIYPARMIPDLLAASEKYPNTVIARSARLIQPDKPYIRWFEVVGGVTTAHWNGHYDEVRGDLNPEGFGGVLYPADILKVDTSMIPEILKFPRADDIWLTIHEQRMGIKSIVPKYIYNKLDVNTRPTASICTQPDNLQMIDSLVRLYKGDLL